MSKNHHHNTVIWDLSTECTVPYGRLIHWRKYKQGQDIISIPQYIEDNASELRNEYIDIIQRFGDKAYDDTVLADTILLKNGMSYWYMTRMAEKSPYKSPNILKIIKCIALKEILAKQDGVNYEFYTDDELTVEVLESFFSRREKKFSVNLQVNKENSKNSLRNIYESLPTILKGLFSIRHHISRRYASGKLKEYYSGENSVFICSYFYNICVEKIKSEGFSTMQWMRLPHFLRKVGLEINWLHHYTPANSTPDLKTTKVILNELNLREPHHLIEAYLDIKSLVKILITWLYLIKFYFKLNQIDNHFYDENNELNLWPYYRKEWKDSFLGTTAIQNLIWIVLFEKCISELPRQKVGFYMWENQAWEQAFLYAWKKFGHGILVAVPTSSIRFWAIGYYDNIIKERNTKKENLKCYPEYIAVNGKVAKKQMIETGCPENMLRDTEALRYKSKSSFQSTQTKKEAGVIQKEIRLLVLGDFDQKQTSEMIECLCNIEQECELNLDILLKLHPSCRLDEKYKYKQSSLSIDEACSKADLIFCGNSTTACIDALFLNKKVIVYLDSDNFNHSPLRGLNDVVYISDHKKLLETINNYDDITNLSATDVLYPSDNLDKWKAFLNTDLEISC